MSLDARKYKLIFEDSDSAIVAYRRGFVVRAYRKMCTDNWIIKIYKAFDEPYGDIYPREDSKDELVYETRLNYTLSSTVIRYIDSWYHQRFAKTK